MPFQSAALHASAFCAALFCVSLTACSSKLSNSPEHDSVSQTVHELILPWHQQFLTSTQKLKVDIEQFCQDTTQADHLDNSRAAWKDAMLSWQTLKLINFGPVLEGNQAWRIQFWPDSHNRVGQRVESVLASDTPITADALAKGNVLVQGLSALEYVLFDPSKQNVELYRLPRTCIFMTAVAENTVNVAQGLVTAWQPTGHNYAQTLLSAGPENLIYPSDKEVLATFVSAMVNSLEIIKNRKIGEAYGGQPGSGRINAYRLELWRSGLSLHAMQKELEANIALFNTSIQPVLASEGHSALADRIAAALTRSQAALKPLPSPLFSQLESPEVIRQAQLAWDELGTLISLLKRDVPEAMHIQLGFNANDGD